LSYLIDTDVLIDGLQRRVSTVELPHTLAPHGVAISIISVGEIYEGAFATTDAARHMANARTFVQDFVVLGLTDNVREVFARERAALRRSGQRIADMDMLIGATAVSYDLELVTRNERHFRRINGLRLLMPS